MASKKSFKADLNPAMQFISTPAEETAAPTSGNQTQDESKTNPTETQTEPKAKPTGRVDYAQSTDSLHEDNAQTAAASSLKGKAPQGYKLNPLYVETRSRRLQLLIQPSLHDRLRARAAAESKSINEIVNSILEGALQEGKQ